MEIPTPHQLYKSYAQHESVSQAIKKAVDAVNQANLRGQVQIHLEYESKRMKDIVAAKFKAKGYVVTESADHGETARGEYYESITVDWSNGFESPRLRYESSGYDSGK
jgi:hypothetical protein